MSDRRATGECAVFRDFSDIFGLESRLLEIELGAKEKSLKV
jgi:hypothetical protein